MTESRSAQRRRRILAGSVSVALGLAGVLVTASPAAADTFTVTNLNENGPGSLRGAIGSANDAVFNPGFDTIVFDPSLGGVIELLSPLVITEGVEIDASGTAATIIITRDNSAGDFDLVQALFIDPDQDLTLRSLQISSDGLLPQQVGRGVIVSPDAIGATVDEVLLDDVVIFNNIGGSHGGGAFVIEPNSVVVQNSIFSSNAAPAGWNGGGLYVDGNEVDTTVAISNSAFLSNAADQGGGLGVEGATVTVTSSQFSLNAALSATGGEGGGALAVFPTAGVDGAVTITDTLFDENAAADTGGGALIFGDDTITLTGTGFQNNNATAGNGGALSFAAPTLLIDGSAFFSNVAGDSGGAIQNGNGFFTATISNTVFEENAAAESGGAISFPIDDDVTIRTSSFIGNSFGNSGGAISVGGSGVDNGTLLIDSSTFADQVYDGGEVPLGATLRAGNVQGDGALVVVNSTIDETNDVVSAISIGTVAGLVNILNSTLRGPSQEFEEVVGDVLVENSIVEGLLAGDEPIIAPIIDGTLTIRYSILGGNAPVGYADGGGNMLDTDPDLGVLGVNGGPTLTRLPNAGSPAIDTGDPAFAPPPAVDQRGTGFARVQNARVDIGAVEIQVPELAATGGTVAWWLIWVALGTLVIGGLALGAVAIRRTSKRDN